MGEDEWANGMVRVKHLESREEGDVKIEDV
jgi:histidyl-tRNA synthetase